MAFFLTLQTTPTTLYCYLNFIAETRLSIIASIINKQQIRGPVDSIYQDLHGVTTSPRSDEKHDRILFGNGGVPPNFFLLYDEEDYTQIEK